MKPQAASDLMQFGANLARKEFAGAVTQGWQQQAIDQRPTVVVQDTVLIRGERVACGSVSYSRATVRVDSCGVLYVTRCDDKAVARIYPAGHWTEAMQYQPRLGHRDLEIDFYLTPQVCLNCGEPVGEPDTYCTSECAVRAETM